MEKEIGCFIQKKLIVIVFGFDDELHRFFAYFLRYFVDAFLKEGRSIRAVCRVFFALLDDLFYEC